MTEVENFLDGFFAAPNIVWPERNQDHRSYQTLSAYLSALENRGECPLVLPRRQEAWDAAVVYVICWNIAHAGRVRPLLDAAVASTWTPFDGRAAQLDPRDPVDHAVLDFVGPGSTFLLRPTAATSAPLFRALDRLVATLQAAPPRNQTLPRPIGRILRDFNSALSAGLSETSLRLLGEMERSGGISLENLAFLQILRLSRLGQDAEVLTHPLFAVIVRAEPPRLVKEALLGSWMRVHGPSSIDTKVDVLSAVDVLQTSPPDVGLLADSAVVHATDEDALRLSGLVAIARGDVGLASAVLDADLLREAEHSELLPVALSEILAELVHDAGAVEIDRSLAPDEGALDETVEASPLPEPMDWQDWLRSLAQGRGVVLTHDLCDSWPSISLRDAQIAEMVDSTPLEVNDVLLTMTPLVLDIASDQSPWRTCAAVIRRYLLGDRLSPSDLGSISALLRMFLSAAPPKAEFTSLLGDLIDFTPRWLSITNADVAIDMADLVATSARPDAATDESFVVTLLSPLVQQRYRLSPLAAGAASMVSRDLNLDWVWSDALASSPANAIDGRKITVLLYSLEDAVLSRVQQVIDRTYTGVTVHASSAKRGSPMLRQQARNADLVVMATRRATHAATGFISENAVAALFTYPDGSGSASMLRAVEEGVSSLASAGL